MSIGVDGVLGVVAGVGDDHRDRLADAAHVAVGEQPERALAVGRLVVDHVVVEDGVEVGARGTRPTTPGTSRAASTSIDTMVPLAMWLRAKATWSVSGSAMSSTYCARPGQEAGVLVAGDPLADEAGGAGHPAPDRAASRTALMIPW